MSNPSQTMIAEQALRRVDDVLAGRDCAWPIAVGECKLLIVLKPHVGKAQALPLSELALRLETNPRSIKLWVNSLRVNFGVQIGASRDADAGGYYIISSAAEALESTQYLVNQATSMWRVVRVLRGRHATAEIYGQVRIELDLDSPQEGTNAEQA